MRSSVLRSSSYQRIKAPDDLRRWCGGGTPTRGRRRSVAACADPTGLVVRFGSPVARGPDLVVARPHDTDEPPGLALHAREALRFGTIRRVSFSFGALQDPSSARGGHCSMRSRASSCSSGGVAEHPDVDSSLAATVMWTRQLDTVAMADFLDESTARATASRVLLQAEGEGQGRTRSRCPSIPRSSRTASGPPPSSGRAISSNPASDPLCASTTTGRTGTGWLSRCTGVPLEAQMCANSSGVRFVRRSRRGSKQAGWVLLYTAGAAESPYHPTPKPSPFVGTPGVWRAGSGR